MEALFETLGTILKPETDPLALAENIILNSVEMMCSHISYNRDDRRIIVWSNNDCNIFNAIRLAYTLQMAGYNTYIDVSNGKPTLNIFK